MEAGCDIVIAPEGAKEVARLHSHRRLGRGKSTSKPAALIVALIICATAAPLTAVTPAVLLGPDLRPRKVTIAGLHGGRLTFFDSKRNLQTSALAQFVQIDIPPAADRPFTPDTEAQPDPPPDVSAAAAAMIELVDGQRFVGQPAGAEDDGHIIRWQHPTLGVVRFALDEVRALQFMQINDRPGPPTPPANLPPAPTLGENASTDIVRVANGDVLTGFVTAIVDGGVEFQPAGGTGGAASATLPFDRISKLQLANPPRNDRPTAHLVHFASGDRWRAGEVSIARDTLQITTAAAPNAAPFKQPMSGVHRIDIASAEGRLIDLAACPMTLISGGQVFTLARPPRIAGRDLHLHAPVKIEFQLPARASRLAMTAELIDTRGRTVPRNAARPAAWADLKLIVHNNGAQLARQPMNAVHPAAQLNAQVTGPTLTIEIDEAANGPIMDRLILLRPTLFVTFD